MSMQVGQRVKVKPVKQLKESFHGQTGTVKAVRDYTDNRSGYLYSMLDVRMDGTVETSGIDGHIVHGNIILPSDCFEVIE